MTLLDEFRRDEQRVLDRLVDGELGLHERRELLAGLDDEPGAWRRCALAFLEAQSWRWQLARAANEPILAQLNTAPPSSPRARYSRWGALLAIAASLLLAFAVGTRFPDLGPTTEPLVANNPAAPTETLPHVVARPDSQPAIDPTADGGIATPETAWQMVTLTPLGDNNSQDSIELRVSADDADQWFAEQSPLSPSLTGSLEQDGWQVDRRRRLVPIALSDGRQLVVPIEEVELRSPDVFQF